MKAIVYSVCVSATSMCRRTGKAREAFATLNQ
jgi:hypothetical protein